MAASEGGPWMRGSWKTERAGRVCGGRLWGPSPTRCAGPARSQASDPGPQRGTRSAWWTPGGWAVTHLMRESDFAAKGRGETNLPRGRGSQRTAGTAQCGDRNEPPGERGSDGESPGFWGKAENYAPLTTSPQLWFLVLKRRTLDETHQWPLVRNRPLWPGVCQTRPVTRVDRPVYCPSQARPASRWARTRGPGSPDPSLGLYLWPPGAPVLSPVHGGAGRPVCGQTATQLLRFPSGGRSIPREESGPMMSQLQHPKVSHTCTPSSLVFPFLMRPRVPSQSPVL